MQKYASNTFSTHTRSMSLCNYDELCRARKCEITRRKKSSIADNVNGINDDCENDSAEFCCETCPLNSDGICEKHVNVLLMKKIDNDYNKNNNGQDDLEVNIRSANNKFNQSSLNNNINNNDRSTIIDINNDQSLKLFFPIKFSCSFLSPDLPNAYKKQSSTLPLLKQQNQQPQSSNSMPPRQGHRRSLSLRQQFEFGYDYLLSEFENARSLAGKTVTHATKTVSQATGAVWNVCHFSNLPKWMQDNEYLHGGHRPPLPTFWDCIKSIFRLHTETGNIWTHGLGALMFLVLFIYEFVTISAHKTAVDRLMLTIYFCGIILCLVFSCLFHTFSCYASPKVIKIFSKLDYCGISLQIIGSMTPALYYGFYEDLSMFKLYISFGVVLCILSIAVSLWDKFGEPQYRSFRAFVFLCFGLSNVIPGVHWYIILDSRLLTAYYMFILQGALYVIGSLLYANRIPERLFPGKCDYMFQSHQIFHVLVVLAALVHLNGINSMAEFRTNHKHLNTIDNGHISNN